MCLPQHSGIRAKVNCLFLHMDSSHINTNRMVSLNGTNYHLWKRKMKDLLYVKSWHLPVFSIERPEGKTDEQWKFDHEQVCGFIRQWVDDNVIY